MANKVKLDLKNLTVPNKVLFMRLLVTMLTGNAHVPTPNPALSVITTKANALETAFNQQQTAQQTAVAKTSALHDAEDDADGSITKLAGSVEEVTDGDPTEIATTGFSTRAPKTPTTSLAAPQNLSVTVGDNEGELDAVWDPVAKAKNYEVQVSDDPPTSSSWRAGDIASASKVTLKNLTSGSKVWVRVRALGPKGLKSPWSDPAVKRVP